MRERYGGDVAPRSWGWVDMGIAELREGWARRDSWSAERDELARLRNEALPELRGIVNRFQKGEMHVGEFRHAMDVFSRKEPYWGFGGTSGQMFLNMLVNAADEASLSEALRRALPAPANEQDCRQKFSDFLALVAEARERAGDVGVAPPSAGYAPYFLSFFWESEEREAWPLYYPASRTELARNGLFVETGPLEERYLSFRSQTSQLRDELHTDVWGLESLLWELNQERKKKEKPEPTGDGGGAVSEPDDLYESYRSQGLIFPDEVITSLVLSLLTKPFVLLSGISGTGKTQIAVGLAEYLERRGGPELVEIEPDGDDNVSTVHIRLTEARLSRGRTNLTREHQAVFALHGGLPERGGHKDYEVTLPDGSAAEMRLNNIGFSDTARELYLLFFRSDVKDWLDKNAQQGDFMRLAFEDNGRISGFEIVRREVRATDALAQRHEVIAVKSDWTDPRGVLGYENPLTGTYSKTDLINILLRATADPDNPYIVILDEMNLARVEYYFSDFLSAMELSDGTLTLRTSQEADEVEDAQEAGEDVPPKLTLPPNVLLIGTVNIDETTFTFSPKVLDRANVLVFNEVDVQRFLEGGGEAAATTFRLKNGTLEPAEFVDTAGAGAGAFDRARESTVFSEALSELFNILRLHNRHFGYRVLKEITTFVGHALERVEGSEEEVVQTAFDLQMLQKVLPKLTGGRELEGVLAELLVFCLDPRAKKNVEPSFALTEARKRLNTGDTQDAEQATTAAGPAEVDQDASPSTRIPETITYPRSAKALERMLTRLQQVGFAAFLE